MSAITGDKEGIRIWSKLFNSKIKEVKDYSDRLYKTLNNNPIVYFSDLEEQMKKRLNNQTIYKMFYSGEKNEWTIELFLNSSPNTK